MSNKEKEIKTLALLEKRVLKLDNQLRLIGNLSNKQYYSLSENKINALENTNLDMGIHIELNNLKLENEKLKNIEQNFK